MRTLRSLLLAGTAALGFGLAGTADAAISHVRFNDHLSLTGSGTSWNTGTITAIGAGDTINIVVIGTQAVTAVSDAAGNPYTIQGSVSYAPGVYTAVETLITGVNLTGAPTQINFTFAATQGTTPTMYSDEYSGVLNINKVAAPVWPANTGSPVSVSITPTVNNTMIWGFMNDDTATIGDGSGFTGEITDTVNGVLTERLQQTTAQQQSVAFTQSGSAQGPVLAAVAMAPVLPNGCSFQDPNGGSFTQFSCTLTNPTAAGDTLAVPTLFYKNFGNPLSDVVTSVTTDKGGSFIQVDRDLSQPAAGAAQSWYLAGAPAGATKVIVNLSAAQQFPALYVDDLGPTGSLDKHSEAVVNSSGAGNTITSNSITPSVNGDIIDAGFQHGFEGTNTANSPFAIAQNITNQGATETYTQPTAGAITASFNLQNSVTGVPFFILAFQPTASQPIITGVTVDKTTFAPNTANATVGGVHVSRNTGTFAGTLAINGPNSCGFHLSSTTLPSNLLAGSTGCLPGIYGSSNPSDQTNFSIVATESGDQNSPKVVPFTGIEAQVISGLTQFASQQFTANVTNAIVGAVSAIGNPTTPVPGASNGTWSIPAGGTCGFHIVNGNQVAAQAGGCSATGGPHSNGTYDDWSLKFTPTNTDISPLTVAAGGEVAVAVAATTPTPQAYPLTYTSGTDMANMPIVIADQARTVTRIAGYVITPVGTGQAHLDVYEAPSGTVCGAPGSNKLNTTSFDANNSPNLVQLLPLGTSLSVPQDAQICLVESGSDWPGTGKGVIEVVWQ